MHVARLLGSTQYRRTVPQTAHVIWVVSTTELTSHLERGWREGERIRVRVVTRSTHDLVRGHQTTRAKLGHKLTCSLVVLPLQTRTTWKLARPTTGMNTNTPTSSRMNLVTQQSRNIATRIPKFNVYATYSIIGKATCTACPSFVGIEIQPTIIQGVGSIHTNKVCALFYERILDNHNM